jgi:hypothetical protein
MKKIFPKNTASLLFGFVCVSVQVLASTEIASQLPGEKDSISPVKPDQILPDNQNTIVLDGISLRKGSIAATAINSARLNDLFDRPISDESSKAIEDIIDVLIKESLGEKMVLLKMFDFFKVEEWLQSEDDKLLGRHVVAALALIKYPNLATGKALDRLKFLKDKSPVNSIKKIFENAITAIERKS